VVLVFCGGEGLKKDLEEVSEGKKRKTKKNLGPVPTSQIQFMP
jgi:hypothetical protein